MKTNQLKLPGAALITVLLLGAAGCHSNGMPENSNATYDTTNNKTPDTIAKKQNVPNTIPTDSLTTDTGKRRMGTVAK